jgi:hypothetical protein
MDQFKYSLAHPFDGGSTVVARELPVFFRSRAWCRLLGAPRLRSWRATRAPAVVESTNWEAMNMRARNLPTGARRATLAGVAVVVALSMALGTAGPAHAAGRVVYRSCGSNWIASDGSNGHYWAQTVKRDGNCAGTLSVAMLAKDGYQSPRVYGNNSSAWTELWNFDYAHSIHWGCNSCSSSWL